FLNCVPPQLVKILVGIFVHRFLKAVHYLCPPAENKHLQAKSLTAVFFNLFALPFINKTHVEHPAGISCQPAEKISYSFSCKCMSSIPEHKGKGHIIIVRIYSMTQFV